MAKTDPLEAHEKFVGRMITGALIAVIGVTTGYAISTVVPAPVPNVSMPATSVSDTARSYNRVERIALRRTSAVLNFKPGFSVDQISEK